MSFVTGLTDTQLRASAVPVSLSSTTITGTVTVSGALTDTQLRASAVPVSLTSTTITGTTAISAASLPLPTGAATSAKQPALGTAGTASTDVITVQGIASGVAQPVSLAANQSVNVTQLNSNPIATGNGVSGTAVQRVAIISDQTAFPVTVTPATPTPYALSSAASTNLVAVKASAGTLYTVTASNNGAAAAFLKLYNLAVAPTLASSVPALIIPIPASSVVSLNLGAMGHRFSVGIAHAITNLVADTDATAVAAAQVKVLLDYI